MLRELVEGLVGHPVGVKAHRGIGVEVESFASVGVYRPVENDVLGDCVTSDPLDHVCASHGLCVDRRPLSHLTNSQIGTYEAAILNVHGNRIGV